METEIYSDWLMRIKVENPAKDSGDDMHVVSLEAKLPMSQEQLEYPFDEQRLTRAEIPIACDHKFLGCHPMLFYRRKNHNEETCIEIYKTYHGRTPPASIIANILEIYGLIMEKAGNSDEILYYKIVRRKLLDKLNQGEPLNHRRPIGFEVPMTRDQIPEQ